MKPCGFLLSKETKWIKPVFEHMKILQRTKLFLALIIWALTKHVLRNKIAITGYLIFVKVLKS